MTDIEFSQFADLSYTGGRSEQKYLLESLCDFLADQVISDVLFKVKGGKEANVYCCRATPVMRRETGHDLIAAKVYRPAEFRAMKNDALYRIGREEVDATGKAERKSRALRAMAKRTKVGKQMRAASWTAHEYRALEELTFAGCDVPQPIASGERAILMQFLGDEAGAAPTLHDAKLTRPDAEAAMYGTLKNLARMLAAGRVHGDLSPYNVLWHRGKAVIIDLPQMVDIDQNPMAFDLLVRDVTRICDHFRRLGLTAPDPGRHAIKLWDDVTKPRM